MRPRLLLTKLLRRWCRHSRSLRRNLLMRDHLRKWCVDDELELWSRHGFSIAVSPRDYASYGIYFFDDYDPEMSAIIAAHLRPGMGAWDLGTERGWFSLIMARAVGERGRVDSFEAFPPNHVKLAANLARNRFAWARAVNAAAAASDGERWFVPPSDEVTLHHSYLSHCRGVGYLSVSEEPGALRVPALALDGYAERTSLARLDVVKIDIEGAEVEALRGARATLTRFRPLLAIEYNRRTLLRAGTSLAELDALLDELGYDRFVYDRGFQVLDLARWADVPDDVAVFNVYAFHRSRA